MNIQGIVQYVFDNRLTKEKLPNKFPNFKFKVGDQEIVLWSAIKPSFLEKGRNISVTCQASKKNGSLFVMNKENSKEPMIQELKAPATTEATEDTSFNPEELEQQLQEINKVAKDLNAEISVEVKKPFNKDELIFTMAILKSFIETGKINANRVEVDLLIKDIKFLYQMNFNK